MGDYSLIILAVAAFLLLWSLAEKLPKMVGEYMDWSKRAFRAAFNALGAESNTFQVFSAETADGKEAEYIDEKLRQDHKIVRSFRAFLISLYLFATIYFLYLYMTR